jgi:hypothetical protein
MMLDPRYSKAFNEFWDRAQIDFLTDKKLKSHSSFGFDCTGRVNLLEGELPTRTAREVHSSEGQK